MNKNFQDWTRKRKIKKEEKKHFSFLRMTHYFLVLVFLVILGYVFLFSSFTDIKKISVQGTDFSEKEIIEKELILLMEQKRWKIFSVGNFFVFSSRQAEAKIKSRLEKISFCAVKKKFPDEIKITVRERENLLIWCSAGPCYLVDEEGYAYRGVEEEFFSENLVKIINKNAEPVSVGDKILEEEYLRFISEFNAKLPEFSELGLPSVYETDFAVAGEMSAMTKNGWMVYFNCKVSPDISLRVLKTFLKNNQLYGEENRLEYVDLRAGNKIFYKLKDEEEKEKIKEEKISDNG